MKEQQNPFLKVGPITAYWRQKFAESREAKPELPTDADDPEYRSKLIDALVKIASEDADVIDTISSKGWPKIESLLTGLMRAETERLVRSDDPEKDKTSKGYIRLIEDLLDAIEAINLRQGQLEEVREREGISEEEIQERLLTQGVT